VTTDKQPQNETEASLAAELAHWKAIAQQAQAELAERAAPSGGVQSTLLAQTWVSERLFANSPMAICYFDRELVFRWANPAYVRLTGVPMEALIGQPFAEVFGRDMDQTYGAKVRTVLLTGEPLQERGAKFVYERDGQTHTTYWDFTYDAVLDAQGRPEAVLFTGQEVTARVEQVRLQFEREEAVRRHNEQLQAINEELAAQAEELRQANDEILGQADALGAQRHFIESLFTTLSAGICFLDTKLIYRMVNPTYARVFNDKPVADYLGRHLTEVLAYTRGDTEAQFQRVLDTGVPWKQRAFPLKVERDDGVHETFWDFDLYAVRGQDGAVMGLVAWVVEVSDRVRIEQEAARNFAALQAKARELAKEKAFAESLIENVPAGVAYLDADWVYRVVNTLYAEGFMKAPREKFLNRYLFDALPGTESQVAHLVRGVFETGQPHYETEFPFRFEHEGRQVTSYWDFVYYPSFADDGRTVDGFFILANEVSARVERDRERERLQRERIEALEQADRLKDEFLSILSHELRTPINAIMGFGSVLDDEVVGPLSPAQRTYTHRILTSADVLLALIDDLLVVSRVQAGKFSVTPQAAAIAELVAAACDLQANAAEKKGVTITVALPPALPAVRADGQRVVQVLNNLIGNAVKFTPEGGHVTVRAAAEGAALRVTVEDTGPGIAADAQARLFQRFGQLDTSNTRSTTGTGLGLFIVKAIVEAHGGATGLDSAEGRGSRFWFTLPLA
jgi:PAS domain S-box-containing protein